MSLTGLTVENFADRVRDSFVLAAADITLKLVLAEVEEPGKQPCGEPENGRAA